MVIHMTRDSVCMGDDIMDNSRNYEMLDDAVWSDIWTLVKERHFLPNISGNNVVWLLMNNNGEEIFSYFTLNDALIKISSNNSAKQICGDSNTLHFRYYVSPVARGKQLFINHQGDMYSMWQCGAIEEYQYCNVTKELEREWRLSLKENQ